DEAQVAASESADDLRARALVLTLRPGASQRRRAIAVLEKLMERQPTPDDQFLLARQYDADGNWRRAKARFAGLLAANADNPDYLAYYALALVRHRELEEAQLWLTKFESLPRITDRFPATEIKARLNAAKGQPIQAVTEVRNYIHDKTTTAAEATARLQRGAALLDSLSQSFPSDKEL